jgi:RhtB (resistance to homoserine/threonine) family protein|tara:strand:+ start:269 stop:889 length:621 start_codon:yes stop_codon:yes gene_type:complete
MENLGLIATVTIVHLLALISPGPDFIVACRNAIQYSRKIGIWTAVGFGIGVCVHMSYAFFGFTWVISQSNFLLSSVKYLGAIYLIYLGISSLFLKNIKIKLTTDQNSDQIKWYTATKMGLLTNLLNPKASLFFLSLFTLVIGPEINPTVMTILTLILVSTTVLWFSLVAIFLTHQKMRNLFENNQKQINTFFGVILIVIGIRIGLF